MKHEFLAYLNPVDTANYTSSLQDKKRMGGNIAIFSKSGKFPSISGADIVIIGVPKDRGNNTEDRKTESPDIIRRHFYSLYCHTPQLKIVDIGNIKTGNSITDTYVALKETVRYFVSNKILVLVIGGSNNMAYANHLAYEKLNHLVNIACIDSKIALAEQDSYLRKIISYNPNYLFNLTNIGYQSYLNDSEAIKVMDSMFFESYRLGIARSKMEEMEPSIRNADIVSFDISAVRHSDAPGKADSSPNGFTGDEFCLLARYAGSSDKTSSIGFYEYDPAADDNEITAKLIAQALWYVIDGYINRLPESPQKNPERFVKYNVASSLFENGLVFYKSKLTNRWWMEVECPEHLRERYVNSYMVSCSYGDYLAAGNNEIPERWMQVYKKLM
ncbi:MAG: formimidoylglutamase [Bacteroidales bacterium]|nr:formimidoylglutamase [Bacteroidales bacterium]